MALQPSFEFWIRSAVSNCFPCNVVFWFIYLKVCMCHLIMSTRFQATRKSYKFAHLDIIHSWVIKLYKKLKLRSALNIYFEIDYIDIKIFSCYARSINLSVEIRHTSTITDSLKWVGSSGLRSNCLGQKPKRNALNINLLTRPSSWTHSRPHKHSYCFWAFVSCTPTFDSCTSQLFPECKFI